jgi:hypothetical protein
MIDSYHARYACGTRHNNPHFRETRCSSLHDDIDTMTAQQLAALRDKLVQRVQKVERCISRRQNFMAQCIHPSRQDQRHANVITDLSDELDICATMRDRILRRLDVIEQESLERIQTEREVIKVVGNVRGTFRYQSSGINTSPGPSQIRKTKRKGKAPTTGPARDPEAEAADAEALEAAFQQRLAQREAARVPIVDDMYRLRKTWTAGAEAFDFIVLAAILQVLEENRVPIHHFSDPYEAMVDDDRITVRMLERIRSLVQNPSRVLIRRGIQFRVFQGQEQQR